MTYEMFSDSARETLQEAEVQACRFNHGYVGTEHLLLAILKYEDIHGCAILRRIGVDPRQVRLKVEGLIRTGSEPVLGEPGSRLPHTPRAKEVLALAIKTSRDLSDRQVTTGHLLAALQICDGVARQALNAVTDRSVLAVLSREALQPEPVPPATESVQEGVPTRVSFWMVQVHRQGQWEPYESLVPPRPKLHLREDDARRDYNLAVEVMESHRLSQAGPIKLPWAQPGPGYDAVRLLELPQNACIREIFVIPPDPVVPPPVAPPSTPEIVATRIVEAVLENLSTRGGFDSLLDRLDAAVTAEMKSALVTDVVRVLDRYTRPIDGVTGEELKACLGQP